MKLPPAMVNWCLNATSSVKFAVNAGCGVNALSGLQKHADSIYCRINVGLISVAHQAVLRLPSGSVAGHSPASVMFAWTMTAVMIMRSFLMVARRWRRSIWVPAIASPFIMLFPPAVVAPVTAIPVIATIITIAYL